MDPPSIIRAMPERKRFFPVDVFLKYLMSCWDRKCELKQNLHLQKFPSLQNTSHTSVKRALFTGCIGDTVYIVYSVYPGYTAYTAYTNFTDYIV